jgi:hypothetical protein
MLSELGIAFTNFQSRKFQFGSGENKQGIEIKFDSNVTHTGNISIEIAEKTNKNNIDYIPSGILRSDNSWLYIQGNYMMFWIFSKRILKLLHRSGRYKEHELATIKKFYLPIFDADKYCAKKFIKQ